MTRCPCGSPADDTIALTSNIHEWHCGTCTTQWALVRNVIETTDKRHWVVGDLRRWQAEKRRAA